MDRQTKPSTTSSDKEQQREKPMDAPPGPRPPPSSPFEAVERFLWPPGFSPELPEASMKRHSFSALVRTALKVDAVERGRIAVSLTVVPHLTNFYNTLHGGAAAAAADVVAQACVMTVVGDKEFFRGESAMSYLSAARLNVKLEIEGRIVRQGRKVTVVSVEFKIKETQQLANIARFTFYSMLRTKL